MKPLSISIPLALAIPTLVSGLLVEPASPQCADTCGNILTSTRGSEMTCDDADYASSTYGATFKACISCELNSTYYNPTKKTSDLQWAIYNLRYALSWCLFGADNNTNTANTPCLTSFSCGPLQSAFEYDSLNPNASSYSYCPLMNSVSAPKCSSCLQEMGNENFLANFVTVLEGACVEQPVLGSRLNIAGNVFSSNTVNVTNPTATPISTYNPSKGGFTLGAKIGVAVGAIVIFLAITGFCIVWNGKRRRRRILAEKARASGYEWQAHHGSMHHSSPREAVSQGPFFDSPQSQKPLFTTNAWGQIISDDSPVSGHPGMSPDTQRGAFEPAYFSPYSSTYTSPVSATDPPGAKKVDQWPKDKKVEPEDGGERIEMGAVGGAGQEYPFPNDKKDPASFGISSMGRESWTAPQPPILSHPGNGRGQGLPGQGLPSRQNSQQSQSHGGLTEDDARKGHAL
ncbi:uncharacterized protein PAC_09125 [Phialocephala subalpina]|uniref:Lpxtg-domain-containing protein n=1 Tax=Phialocephala subalpina TaxID=576137 RepID=A0A1L7X2I5_9HELO|nr:uncharacterized protein PAC_09125 [Phialocephala subalpina]